MRETLSILKDFSIDDLYLMLTSGGTENTSRKDKALENFEKLNFFGEYNRDDYS